MFPSHNTCKPWNRKNQTDHKASSLLLKKTKICVLGAHVKADKEKTIRIQKNQEPCSGWDPSASSQHLLGRLLNREIKPAHIKCKNPLWILDLVSTEIFSNLTNSAKWSFTSKNETRKKKIFPCTSQRITEKIRFSYREIIIGIQRVTIYVWNITR